MKSLKLMVSVAAFGLALCASAQAAGPVVGKWPPPPVAVWSHLFTPAVMKDIRLGWIDFSEMDCNFLNFGQTPATVYIRALSREGEVEKKAGRSPWLPDRRPLYSRRAM